MRIGVIIETKEFEKSWNAMRFAVTARKGGNEVKVFLMGEAVEIESLHHENSTWLLRLRRFMRQAGKFSLVALASNQGIWTAAKSARYPL